VGRNGGGKRKLKQQRKRREKNRDPSFVLLPHRRDIEKSGETACLFCQKSEIDKLNNGTTEEEQNLKTQKSFTTICSTSSTYKKKEQ
jgi:hypothetical protein